VGKVRAFLADAGFIAAFHAPLLVHLLALVWR
jgi:hypothetical protein